VVVDDLVGLRIGHGESIGSLGPGDVAGLGYFNPGRGEFQRQGGVCGHGLDAFADGCLAVADGSDRDHHNGVVGVVIHDLVYVAGGVVVVPLGLGVLDGFYGGVVTAELVAAGEGEGDKQGNTEDRRSFHRCCSSFVQKRRPPRHCEGACLARGKYMPERVGL